MYKATRKTSVGSFDYAIKILDPSSFIKDYDKALRRFSREVNALRALQHRGIVQYHDAGITQDKKPYIVMPFIEGKNVRSVSSSVTLEQYLKIFVEILNALHYAHKNDVIHRDLKPSNVLVRLTDL